MTVPLSAGKKFRQALEASQPLPIMGTINAYCALQAQQQGATAIYLSGAGCANASYGLPDLGMTQLEDVLIDAERITRICPLPLLVDIDTGWDDVGETVSRMIEAGVAAVHLEDQVALKRCGHRPNKQCVSIEDMQARIESGVAAQADPDFMLIARTDTAAREGVDAAIKRALAYVEAGAHAIFAEALTSLEEYRQFCSVLSVPVQANITEFGRTPVYSQAQLAAEGVAMVLYPLTAFRAMSFAAENVYKTVLRDGSQQELLALMQTRESLYETLNYHAYEQSQDLEHKQS